MKLEAGGNSATPRREALKVFGQKRPDGRKIVAAAQTDERRRMAALLRRKADGILEDWERVVRVTIPGNGQLSKSLLRDSLPLLLHNLANALEDARWKYHLARNVEIALEHGRQRYRINGHQFDQVVDEYAELRKAIVRNVASDAHSTAEAVEVIHEFIDASIKHASGFFAALQRQDDKKALTDELDHTKGQRDGLEDERDSIRDHAEALEQERQLRSEVICMLGHDMRTPLSAALLAAQMVARNPQSAVQDPKRMGRVIGGLERLDAMLQNLLDADRLRTGQPHPIEVRFCSLSDVFWAAHRELTEVHGSRFVTLVSEDVNGHWDCAALQRVIENLANNAVKYAASDKTILLQLAKESGQVEIRVHNAGGPIPSHIQPSLLEPHFRADEAARSAKAGWGLGLALVKAVAEAHGGAVSGWKVSRGWARRFACGFRSTAARRSRPNCALSPTDCVRILLSGRPKAISDLVACKGSRS